LARSLAELREDVEGAEERSRVLSSSVESMREELARAEETGSQQARVMEEAGVLEKSVATAREELTSLEREVEARKLSLRQGVEVAQLQLVSDLRGVLLELRRLQEEVVDEGAEFAREVAVRRALVAQVQKEAANLAQSTASRAVYREQISALEQRVFELKGSLKQLQDQHYNLKEEEEEMLVHQADVQRQVRVLEMELLAKKQEHQQQMKDMAHQCQEAEQSKMLLGQEVEQMRRDLVASREHLAQASSEVGELEARHCKLSEETASLRRETDRLQQLEQKLRESINGKHTSLRETETLLAQRHEELVVAEDRRGEVAQTLEATEAKMEAAKEELRALKAAASQVAAELQDQQVQEKAQRAGLADLHVQRHEVKTQVDDLHKRLLVLQAAQAKQEKRRAVAEEKASACQQAAHEFVNELEALKTAAALTEESLSRHYTSTIAAAHEAGRAVYAEVEWEMAGLEKSVRDQRLTAEEARKEADRAQEDLQQVRADLHRWECSSREAQREATRWQQQAKDEEERVQDLEKAIDSKKGVLKALDDTACDASTALASKHLEVEEATRTLQELEAKTLQRYEGWEQTLKVHEDQKIRLVQEVADAQQQLARTQLNQEAAALELQRLSALQKQVLPLQLFLA